MDYGALNPCESIAHQKAMQSWADYFDGLRKEFCQERYPSDCEETLRGIANSTRSGGEEILRVKGATNYGIGAALTRIATAILRDENAVPTVSTVAPEAMELAQVSLSLPVIVGREGVQRVLPFWLSEEEDRALRRSAEILSRHIALLGLPPGCSIPQDRPRQRLREHPQHDDSPPIEKTRHRC